jgi:hypothetical protein
MKPNALASYQWLASVDSLNAYKPHGKTFNETLAGYQGRYRVARIERVSMWVADSHEGEPRLEEDREVIRTKSGLYWDASTGNLLSFRQDAYEAAGGRSWMSAYEPLGNEPFAPGEK